MNASELRVIMEEQKCTYDEVIELCTSSAKRGECSYGIFKFVDIDVIQKLAVDGFKTTFLKGHMGEKITNISWE